jgi:hypothetical protein
MVPLAATVMPLPTELTTPPVTKIYFGIQEHYTPTHPEKTSDFLESLLKNLGQASTTNST